MTVSINPQKPLRSAVDAFLSEICVICGYPLLFEIYRSVGRAALAALRACFLAY